MFINISYISYCGYILNVMFKILSLRQFPPLSVCSWCFHCPVAALHHKMRWDPRKTQTTATVAQIAWVGQLWSGPLMSQVTEFKFAPCDQEATETDFFFHHIKPYKSINPYVILCVRMYLCAYCVKELLFITYYIIVKLTRRNKHHFNIKLSIQLFYLIRIHLLKCFLRALKTTYVLQT